MDAPSSDDWFRNLYDAHHADVLAYLIRRTSPDPEAAAADVFLVAWRRRSELRDKGEMLPWLYGTARRVLANQHRSSTRRLRLHVSMRRSRYPDPETPETIVVLRERDREVLAALDRLRPPDREVIRLAVWEELPHEAIGEVLGCSDRAATMRLHRAIRRLERELHVKRHGSPARVLAPKTEANND